MRPAYTPPGQLRSRPDAERWYREHGWSRLNVRLPGFLYGRTVVAAARCNLSPGLFIRRLLERALGPKEE